MLTHYIWLLYEIYPKNIEMLGEGSTGQTELSRVLLSDLEIDIIENIEQQRIVSEFLKVIDTKIELNQQVNKTLKRLQRHSSNLGL